MSRSVGKFALALISAASLAGIAAAQAPAPPVAGPKEYKPGLADLMLLYIQPRHAKLGLAGAEGNWAQAMFSVTELTHAFERAGGQVPKWRQLLIPEMTAAMIDGPVGEVVKAIKARDAAAFQRGYQQLTAGCNACHAAAGLEHIAIKAPDRSAFPNQDFAPPKR